MSQLMTKRRTHLPEPKMRRGDGSDDSVKTNFRSTFHTVTPAAFNGLLEPATNSTRRITSEFEELVVIGDVAGLSQLLDVLRVLDQMR